MTKIEWLKANGYKRSKSDKNIYQKSFSDCMLTLCIKVNENGEDYGYLKIDNEPLTELDRRFWIYLGTKFCELERDIELMAKETNL